MTRWLHLAAAPAVALMVLVTAASDSSAPMALCSGGAGFGIGGMAPMYVLMAVFHSAPWLKLIPRRRDVTLFSMLERRSHIQTMEQKP
jgi:hypothetical protein